MHYIYHFLTYFNFGNLVISEKVGIFAYILKHTNMTIENYFSDKEFIELPDLIEFGINAEVFTDLAARDLDTDALILAFKKDGLEHIAFIHPDKIEVRQYLFNESNYMDSLTYNSANTILGCCGFKEYTQPESSIHIYDDSVYYVVTDRRITVISYDEDGILNNAHSSKMSEVANLDLIQELEGLLGRDLYPRLEWTIDLDIPVVNVCGDDYMTQEEYLHMLVNKLSDSDIVDILETYEIVNDLALNGTSDLERVDEVIRILEDRLVCNFIDKGDMSVIRGKILEEILS